VREVWCEQVREDVQKSCARTQGFSCRDKLHMNVAAVALSWRILRNAMSLHARPARLCHSCRYDLLSLFELGFSAPRSVPAKRSFLASRLRARPSARNQTRSFTSKQRSLQQDDRPPRSESGSSNLKERLTVEEQQQIELQALERIEKELGKPLDEAIREDELAALEIQEDVAEDSGDLSADYMVEEAIDQVEALREAGGSIEEIVREARSVFGEYLPEGTLDEYETKLYVRLYGEPVDQDIMPEEYDEEDAGVVIGEDTTVLVDADGEILADYRASMTAGKLENMDDVEDASNGTVAYQPFSDEAAARAQDIVKQLGGELYEPDERRGDEEEDGDEDESPDPKAHPLTTIGKFATSPRTVFLNQESFVQPLTELLGAYSNKQLKDMCEKTFGGPGLPDSAFTPRSAKGRKPIAIPLDPSQHVMGEMEANAYFTTVVPPTYAAITSVLTETRKRLGSSWLRELIAKSEGPRILDAGAGGAGILAWRDIVNAEWQTLDHGGGDLEIPPPSKAVVLAGSDTLRHRSAALLENTTFIPRLPDYVHSRDGPTIDDDRPAQARKEFDVIIAPHTLFPLKEEWQRKQQVQNLWSLLSPNGGVLILIEKGIPRGFEAIAAARELLLDRYIASPGSEMYESELQNALSQEEQIIRKDLGMIVAPCTNHTKCPMYTVHGVARGRKDMCSFQQRYIRPGFLQRILGATDRNHDEVDFSYISLLKGKDIRSLRPQSETDVRDPWGLQLPSRSALPADEPSEGFSLSTDSPRVIYPPLKRRGHVTMDLCTPRGKIERWTVPKSFGKQAYRDARKSKWGDLWALDAKTKIMRNLQLGTKTEKEQMIRDRMADEAAERRERAEEAALNEIAYAEVESEDIVKRRPREPRVKEAKLSEKAAKDVRTLGRAASKASVQNEEEPEAINAFLEDWESDFSAATKKYPGRKGTKSSDSSRAAKKFAKMQRAGVEPNMTLPWMQSNRVAGKRRVGRDAERSGA
jgi:ribosomal protein RSM22 (predicted rRNA methylase)